MKADGSATDQERGLGGYSCKNELINYKFHFGYARFELPV